MDKFPERHKVPKLTLKDIDSLIQVVLCPLKKMNLICISKSPHLRDSNSINVMDQCSVLRNILFTVLKTLL